MSLTTTTFTNLHPKRGDITGSPEQAFGTVPTLMDYVIGGIKGNTIAAIGMIALGTHEIQYLYAPRVHTDLGGEPISNIGNVSNNQGEYTCVMMPLASLRFFTCITEKADASLVPYGDDFDADGLKNTKWHAAATPIVGFLLPNFFIIYFGQDTPTGNIANDDVKMKLSALGQGYDTWVSSALSALNAITDTEIVFDNGGATSTDEHFINKYLSKVWDPTSSLKLTAEGPCNSFAIANSNFYPVEAAELKQIFLAARNPLVPNPTGPSTLTIQHPGEAGQEADAKKGEVKLLLMCLRGDINIHSGSLTNIAFAAPAPGMQIVMDNPRSGRPVALSDLLRQTFAVTKDLDPNDIRSRELSMVHVSKSLASHMLLGNFATRGITSSNNEANSVDPSAFLPQRNLAMIEAVRSADSKHRAETGMDVIDSHKSKVSTAITRIGEMKSMRDITSLCINVMAVISAITSDTGPDPILKTIMSTIIQVTINRDWEEWMETCGAQMPYLHFHFYSFIDRMWNLLADGATEFNNINVVTKSRPIGDMNTAGFRKALHVLKALLDNVSLNQSQGTPIIVQATLITKYCPTAILPNQGPNPYTPSVPHHQNHSPSTSGISNQGSATAGGARKDRVTFDEGSTKKPRTSAGSDVSSRGTRKDIVKKDMGMFYLKNTSMRAADVFPKDLEEKVCVDFTCKDRECTKEGCTLKHPRWPKDLSKETNESIARNFLTGKHGWCSNYHYRNYAMPPDLNKIMGGSDGPANSKN